jgi:hypothetical protein
MKETGSGLEPVAASFSRDPKPLIRSGIHTFPPLKKGGQGGFGVIVLKIPLDPPFSKGEARGRL